MMTASAFPPAVPYYQLNVPRDLVRLFGLQSLHAQGITGRGVKVAMIDTGFYSEHPYYNTPMVHGGRHLDITTHSVQSDPDTDEYGHGTAIAANLLAVAPECEFHHVKDDGDYLSAFDIARESGAQIITCSWGYNENSVREALDGEASESERTYFQTLEESIREAVAEGVTVVVASGNGDMPGSWPSGIPEVIAVGGAMIDTEGNLKASDYSTSYISQIYEGRRCPDVCGLVGPAPNGLWIMLPTQPGNELDEDFSALDATQQGDGWLVASGTSSSTPQVAGFAALLLQSDPDLTPAEIKSNLEAMAVGVILGKTATGHHAGLRRPNLATGYGLVTLARPNRVGGYTFF